MGHTPQWEGIDIPAPHLQPQACPTLTLRAVVSPQGLQPICREERG